MVDILGVTRALLSMGYRKIWRDDGSCDFAKPLGYSLFVFNKKDGRLYCYYRGVNEQLLCMESWDIVGHPVDPLTRIKEAENYVPRASVQTSHFEFLTPEQVLAEEL